MFSHLQRSRFMWKNPRTYPVTEHASWHLNEFYARFSHWFTQYDISEEFCKGEIEFAKGNYDISYRHFLKSIETVEPYGWKLLDWDRCTAYAKIGLILNNPKSGVEFSPISARRYFLLSLEDNGLNLSCDLRQQICTLLIEDFTYGKGGDADPKRAEEFTQLKQYLKDRELMDRGH